MSDKTDKSIKRKRRGGLRIPSDKVPRAKTSPEVAAPAPEDPHLAMSVAYAFGGGNGSGAAALEAEPDEVRDTIRNRTLPMPGNEDRRRRGEDDFGDDGTIELDSVSDLEDVEPLEGELTEAATDHPNAPDNDDDDSDIRATTPIAPVGPRQLSRPATPAESVDIAFDEEEDAEVEETDPLSDEVNGGEPEEPPARPKFHRARTVALSDQDLEELMEGELLPTLSFDDSKTMQIDEADRPRRKSGIPEPRDPGDSGEIIADDMIEEIDENANAKPVGLMADPEAHGEPPGDPIEPKASRTRTITGERRTENSEPPPPPPPRAEAKSTPKKPPPAPAKTSTKPAPAAAAPAEKSRRRKPWFEEIFDENYLRTLPFLTPQATESEADFVIASLGLEPGSQILDVGCGYGRHSMELAARGYHMVGLDSSLPLLLRGADEAQRRGLNINFVHGDMREMQFESQFDGAFCLFETFGYFDDETNKVTAKNIARSLKPGARMVLDVLNRDYLIRDLPTRVWWEGDGCVVLEEVDFNYFSSRIVSTRSIAFEDGRQLEQEISIRAFALHELGKLLHAAGFRVVEVSGSMVTRGRFFGGHSRDLIVVAEKRSGASRTTTDQ